MTEVEKHIAEIQQKVQLLLKQQAALQKENLRLRAGMQQLEENESGQLQVIEALTHQNQILKAGLQELDPAEKKKFISKINSYVKHIDACISLLSK